MALVVFTSAIGDDDFVDEYAYITQSYYSDLYFGGRWNDPAWLDLFAFDLQPLPKYFIGPVLHAAGLPMPRASDALHWYRDPHFRFGTPGTLTLARIPFIATGVLGCLSLFGCGTLIGGGRVAAIAAVLLTIDPLYRLHAHRAMSDVPCEAFMISALGLALWGATRVWSGRLLGAPLLLFAAAGACAGLSIVCKLNGLLAPIVIGIWCLIGIVGCGLGTRRGLGFAVGSALSLGTMLAAVLSLNPTLTCHPRVRAPAELAARAGEGPWARAVEMVRFRFESAAGQQQMGKFQPDVLRSPVAKAAVFAVQGFGRFGPFGPARANSKVRYDVRQDWGMLAWWPIVIIGICRTYRLGRQQLRDGTPPSAFALLAWGAVSWAVVGSYVPLAWDRYFLPIQAPNALLGAVGIAALMDRRGRKAVSE